MATQTAPKRDAITRSIRHHYDTVTGFYRRLWGEHIHHGFWEGDEPLPQAQRQLIEKLADQAGIRRGSRVLDVGCGLGGSSLSLAHNLNCEVVGITLSPVQARSATSRALRRGMSEQVSFIVHDANDLSSFPGGFDVVWCIECSEHLHDKKKFIEQCARLLNPGGVLAICAWTDKSTTPDHQRLVSDICDAMICPALARLDDYAGWFASAGFSGVFARDVSRSVERTWDLAVRIVNRWTVRFLLPFLDARTRRFAASFAWMQRAFRDDAMGYGMITGRLKK